VAATFESPLEAVTHWFPRALPGAGEQAPWPSCLKQLGPSLRLLASLSGSIELFQQGETRDSLQVHWPGTPHACVGAGILPA